MSKPFWKSKTFWAAVFTAIVTFYDGIRAVFPELPPIPEEVIKVLQALGLLGVVYGRAVAQGPLAATKPSDKQLPLP